MGISVESPWQRRTARGGLWAAEMDVARQRALLHQQAHSISHELANILRDIGWLHEEYMIAED